MVCKPEWLSSAYGRALVVVEWLEELAQGHEVQGSILATPKPENLSFKSMTAYSENRIRLSKG